MKKRFLAIGLGLAMGLLVAVIVVAQGQIVVIKQ